MCVSAERAEKYNLIKGVSCPLTKSVLFTVYQYKKELGHMDLNLHFRDLFCVFTCYNVFS